RPAAAGRDRPGVEQRTVGRSRRRTNRKSGQRRHPGRPPPLRAPARGRADAAGRHPRRPDRGHRRPADLDARRRVRRRDQVVRWHHWAARRPCRAGGLRAMGRILLVGRLAVRDLRRRRIETALLLLAIMAATTTLTLGLVLHKAASDPYQSTREATKGPDLGANPSPYY